MINGKYDPYEHPAINRFSNGLKDCLKNSAIIHEKDEKIRATYEHAIALIDLHVNLAELEMSAESIKEAISSKEG